VIYTAGPPAAGGGAPLWITRAVRRRFTGPADLAGDPDHRARLGVYLADLLRPYGLDVPPGRLDAMAAQSYGDMAEAVLAAAVPPGEEADLVVLAFAIPDVAPGRATAIYLSHVCPGNRFAFAVCDQGPAAAFTGVRLAREYLGAGGCRRALVLLVEQADLPYDPAAPVAMPTAHTAVGLLCDRARTAADPDVTTAGVRVTAVRQVPGVPPDGAAARLAADLAGRPAAATVLVSGDLAVEHPGPVVRAPAGQPFTGVWWDLAGRVGAGVAGPVVLATYDATLGYLCVADVDITPAASGAARSGTAGSPTAPRRPGTPAAPAGR
jgi:4-hydroxymandelate oxidase